MDLSMRAVYHICEVDMYMSCWAEVEMNVMSQRDFDNE